MYVDPSKYLRFKSRDRYIPQPELINDLKRYFISRAGLLNRQTFLGKGINYDGKKTIKSQCMVA
jgi:hypothetical protein